MADAAIDTRIVEIDYEPRAQFRDFHARKERYCCIVAHRRAGKTVACINDLLRAATVLNRPNPRFAYIAPSFTQAKDVAWEYLKHYAAPMLQFGGGINESELRVDLPNGGRVRLYGAENSDRLRGLYLDGVVLDEFATMDPRVWEAVRPALSDRAGWCVWIGTPNGHNEFYNIWKRAQDDSEYLALMLKASETGILPETELRDARRDMTPEQFAREYECSFDAAIQGAYYGPDMEAAEKEKRITTVPYDKSTDVITAWDLGIGDSTAIFFAQFVGHEIHIIDYVENSGVGLDWYVRELKDRRYVYGEHIFPHDVESRELGTGKTRKDVLESLGIGVTVAKKLSLEDGVNAVRNILNRCWFDKDKCARGIEALKQYRREWDNKGRVFRDKPLHDWTSHAADAFRYLAVGLPTTRKEPVSQEIIEWKVNWVP